MPRPMELYQREPYVYLPLVRLNISPFRLLYLHAGQGAIPLSCDIVHSSLEDASPVLFDALSYVWGPPEEESSAIFVARDPRRSNQDLLFTSIPLRRSLLSALQRLRHPTETRIIWVDALCINQSDHAERNQQVPMMGQIYHIARSVIVWLGEESEDSTLALEFIPEITNLSRLDHIIKDVTLTRHWHAFSRLMNRPWFSRRWVVQELAFAREAWIYCGDREIDWLSFADAATLFGKKQQDIVKLFWMSQEYAHDAEIFGEVQALGALRLINALNRLFRRSEDGQILGGLVSLETLVTSLGVFQTKDPRDCIYSVMRLAEDAQHVTTGGANTPHFAPRPAAGTFYPVLGVDYALPFCEIARSFVAFCIKTSLSLDIICRPWAPIPNFYGSSNSDYTALSAREKLSSWACNLEDSAFGIREDGHLVRKRGDSFVGDPGRSIYQASKGFPTISFDPPNSPRSQFAPYLEIARFPIDAIDISFKAPRMMVKGLPIGLIHTLGERAMEGTIPSG